jgi:hypothetical protein
LEECIKAHLYQFRYKNRKDYFKIDPKIIKKTITNCKIIVKEFTNNNDSIQNGGNKIIDINDPEFDCKMNNQIKIQFSNYTDNILWNVYDNPTEAYYHGKMITKKLLNLEILPKTLSKKIIILPIHRDSELYINIELNEKMYTYKQLFQTLYTVYNKTLVNKTFLSKIKDDLYDYKRQALKKLNHNKKVYLVDLIGNMCRFEAVYLINENFDHIYTIFLGS